MVSLVGATPVFADVNERSFNLDPASVQRALAAARDAGLRPKAVIPVDLFGQPADHEAIAAIAKAENLFVLDDAAQAMGATYHGRPVGTLALATATSFFPAKPLGCYGDGGAVFTDDDELAETVRSLRVHGAGRDRYDCDRDRDQRPLRYHPGRHPDRKAENLSRRDRRARAQCRNVTRLRLRS